GGMISDRAKVDFRNPDIRIRIYVGEKIYICSESAQIDRSQYEKRKNRLLPFTSPISIHPRLARALINITSKKGDRNVLDPFCGTGTFLIEARLLGFQTFGSDISDRMIKGSRRNLDHLRLRANLRQCDIGEISGFKKKFDCIVTDPPYGRSSSTNKESISSLYSRAVEAFSDNLKEKGRVGIIVPRMDMLDYKKYFKMVKSTSIRVHRSLVRNFVVLEKE
ncbi:MAG: DNA methyltransferase, partial [Thermoplasmata archaeon]|nr:DNA methyltransferase [Thermoplasmata archaeon]